MSGKLSLLAALAGMIISCSEVPEHIPSKNLGVSTPKTGDADPKNCKPKDDSSPTQLFLAGEITYMDIKAAIDSACVRCHNPDSAVRIPLSTYNEVKNNVDIVIERLDANDPALQAVSMANPMPPNPNDAQRAAALALSAQMKKWKDEGLLEAPPPADPADPTAPADPNNGNDMASNDVNAEQNGGVEATAAATEETDSERWDRIVASEFEAKCAQCHAAGSQFGVYDSFELISADISEIERRVKLSGDDKEVMPTSGPDEDFIAALNSFLDKTAPAKDTSLPDCE